jgi:hypothetical protein
MHPRVTGFRCRDMIEYWRHLSDALANLLSCIKGRIPRLRHDSRDWLPDVVDRAQGQQRLCRQLDVMGNPLTPPLWICDLHTGQWR